MSKEENLLGLHTLLPLQQQASYTEWSDVPKAILPLLIGEIVNHDLLTVVLVEDEFAADQIATQISFFTSKDLFPKRFIDSGILLYDHFSATHATRAARIETLCHMPNITSGCLVVSLPVWMTRLCPKPYLLSRNIQLAVGDVLEPSELIANLTNLGYTKTNLVEETGTICSRGAIIDLFPLGTDMPIRIEFFDTTIESLRLFDVKTQCSLETIKHIHIQPATEFDVSKTGIAKFRYNWRAQISGNIDKHTIYQTVSSGEIPDGIESYIPLFFDSMSCLADYLPQRIRLISTVDIPQAAQRYYQEVEQRYQTLKDDTNHPVLPTEKLLLASEFVLSQPCIQNRLQLSEKKGSDNAQKMPDFLNQEKLPSFLKKTDHLLEEMCLTLVQWIKKNSGRVLIVAENRGRVKTIQTHFKQLGEETVAGKSWLHFLKDNAKITILEGALEHSFVLKDKNITVIAIQQILESQFHVPTKNYAVHKKQPYKPGTSLQHINELSIGDPVVHEMHGVGRYQGLIELKVDGIRGEFICLEYAENDKLYVPTESIILISRYVGAKDESAPLHSLRNQTWKTAKKKALAKIRDVASELLALHAKRRTCEKQPTAIDEPEYTKFVEQFPFAETADQYKAITDIQEDLAKSYPMDRIVCGDVGFGKTEVAMRAAFIIALSGQQVAILAPTTLLVRQHAQNFQDRFAQWPIKVAELSRFKSATAQKEVLHALAQGDIDIIIGTHALLQSRVQFKDLGLVIIDEEHRFGVMQKERLKKLRVQTHILSLTATPIPRSLHLSLSGLREISIIASPPEKRQPVESIINEWDESIITEAISRELHRGGQVFFVHHEIRTIKNIEATLRSLPIKINIAVAHGGMRNKDLEQIVSDFYHHRYNILLCTTIIENGIDIPTANTIIVNHADRFGMAQLYQLRGRVGRSTKKAYAYFLIPSWKILKKDAKARLDALADHQELGVGFSLAMRDMEIRGCGEILGESQSGQVQEIGLSMYQSLLDKTLKSGVALSDDIQDTLTPTETIDLRVAALIPKEYIESVHLRLLFYSRIAKIKNTENMESLLSELEDRFGTAPIELKALLQITTLKKHMKHIGIEKMVLHEEKGFVRFLPDTPVEPHTLAVIIQKQPDIFKITNGGLELKVTLAQPHAEDRLLFAKRLLEQLKPQKSLNQE